MASPLRLGEALKDAWKFAYWPMVWLLSVILPYLVFGGDSSALKGGWALLLRITGAFLALYATMLTSLGGRTLHLYGHSRPDSFWPDRLVDRGIYSCSRHPQHTGLALIPPALAFILASPPAILASGWGVVATLLFVLLVEEPECLSKFGDSYYAYMRHVTAMSIDPRCIFKGFKALRRV